MSRDLDVRTVTFRVVALADVGAKRQSFIASFRGCLEQTVHLLELIHPLRREQVFLRTCEVDAFDIVSFEDSDQLFGDCGRKFGLAVLS